MISKKTQYALHALLALADAGSSSRPVLISDLARKNHIPKKFLELILLELKNKGILASKKGKGGGYTLARHPKKILLSEILPLQEDLTDALPCLILSGKPKRCEPCRDLQSCGTRIIMQEVSKSIAVVLGGTTLDDLLEKSRSQQETMYYI
jgi:Rrf2 family protein